LQPASTELKDKVAEYVAEFGQTYAPITHPDFAHFPYNHGPARVDGILPHLGPKGRTVLDIGTNWGYVAHRLEEAGYKVTAIEHADKHFYFLKAIRDLCERDFEVIHGSVFDLKDVKYDIVLALAIFHHFLKSRAKFEAFEALLARMECDTMIFQSHSETERQMDRAYKNMDQDSFAEFLSKRLKLPNIEVIGQEKRRKLYKLSR